MKKTIIAVALTLAVGLAGFQVVEARPGGGPGWDDCCAMSGMGGMGQKGGAKLDSEQLKAREKFFAETTELRKRMFVKKSELEAVMSGANPDEKKAARLSEEFFDLKEQMQKKAQEAGMGKAGFACAGPGMEKMGMGGHGGQHRARR